MKKICIICMRKGSSEVKNKNLKIVNNKPLLFYTINQALQSKIFDSIVVSTDSIKILNLSKKFGAECWFLRPKKLATNKISKRPAIIHALHRAEKKHSVKYDVIFDLDVTSPLRNINDVQGAVDLYLKKKADSVISLTAQSNPISWYKEVSCDGKINNEKAFILIS